MLYREREGRLREPKGERKMIGDGETGCKRRWRENEGNGERCRERGWERPVLREVDGSGIAGWER